jgi:hypothetical protein
VAQIVHDMERRLRDARPEPSSEFVDRLEQRLLPVPRPRRRPIIVARVVVAASLALALVLAILGLAGALPRGLTSEEPVRATDGCRTVMVETVVRRPEFVVGEGGKLRVIYRREVVQLPQRRCR